MKTIQHLHRAGGAGAAVVSFGADAADHERRLRAEVDALTTEVRQLPTLIRCSREQATTNAGNDGSDSEAREAKKTPATVLAEG